MRMTEQQVYDVPVPEATKSYSPVPHQFVSETLQNVLSKYGVGVRKKHFATNSSGTQLVARFDLDQVTKDRTLGYRICFQNSYDKSMSVGFHKSAVVLVCDNGMMVEVSNMGQYRRKHTGNVQQILTKKIKHTLKGFPELMKQTVRDAEAMKQIKVDRTAAAELCGRMFIEHELINTVQLNVIKKELETPSYKAFAEPTLWSLYNHMTHSIKEAHPTKYVQQHQSIHKFVKEQFNL